MTYGIQKYYKEWNKLKGPNYFIFNRLTGEKVGECNESDKADELVKELNRKDLEKRGIKPADEIEVTSYHYRDKTHPVEVAPMPVYK